MVLEFSDDARGVSEVLKVTTGRPSASHSVANAPEPSGRARCSGAHWIEVQYYRERMTEQQLERTSNRAIDVALVVAVYTIAAVVLIVPTFMLAVGVQALGDAAGWWQGDPNSNDGEESWATGLGVGAYVVVLAVVALIVRALTRRFGIPFLPGVIAGSVALVLGAIIACAWYISL